MRIRTIHKDVPLLVSKPHILPALEIAGIKTTHDVLFTPLPELLSRLSTAQDILTTDIIQLQDEIAAACAVPGVRGDELLEKEASAIGIMKPYTFTALGVEAVDDLLGETLYGPYVVEISGTAGSGKSTIAMQVALRRLSHEIEATALWIDCSGDFSGERAERICQNLRLDQATTMSVLSRVQVILSFEIEEFQNALDNIEGSLAETPEASLRYIVIDPITPLLAGQITGSSSQGHATMTNVMRQLARIAEDHKLTVLVLNKTASSPTRNPLSAFSKTTAKPALGPTFTFLSHATVWLSVADATPGRRDREGKTHIVEVFRSRVGPAHCWCTFDIRDGTAVPSDSS
ncbi:DNA repair protein RAD51 homolog 4 OS=Mus musculus GN=Rad51d PE=2 SV=1 [Rhizoctonia solani AG-1 IB]|uniref:DNA repair protein RAD51 homolog 4 n=1 Tax=Thanatephorus cucumeris (strain AG1-IB / isolate 7/3/14) TaxID=1108050 RepID=A0A0B7FH08_THACB|nr:DNA repair protein RAD51 homolog 4 OS=Mus musculus GN=Rad51d PE=2 SV=1 [Rhizoctonia solani AG-1 IB]